MFVEAAVYPGTYNITDPWIVSNNLNDFAINPLYQYDYHKAYLNPPNP